MSNSDKKICRLCLDITPFYECEAIDVTKKEILDVLLINVDVDISSDVVACNRCLEMIQNFYDFKLHCITTYTNQINEKICLQSSQICRLCLSMIEINTLNFTTNSNLKDEVSLKDIVVYCFPEVNIDNVRDLILCDSCQSRVKEYYEFMRRCEKVEQRIHNYCQVGSHGSVARVNLEDMLKFGHHEMLSKPTIIKKECPNAESIDANVKNEENTIKCEEVHIKDEELDAGVELGVTDQLADHVFFGKNGSSEQKPMLESPNEKHHLCPRCPNFKSRYFVEGRMVLDSDGETCTCRLCPLLTATGLSKQYRSSHEGTRKAFRCCECSYETDRKYHLNMHFVKHQNKLEIGMFKCAKCKFETKHKNSLRNHMKIHEDPNVAKKFKCEECPFWSIWRYDIKKHMVRYHNKTHVDPNGTKIFKCEQCPFKCNRSYKLKQHMARHFDKTHEDPNVAKKFKCEECPFRCTRRYNLNQHMARHSNKTREDPKVLKKFKCEECPFRSRRIYNLEKHMATHLRQSRLELGADDQLVDHDFLENDGSSEEKPMVKLLNARKHPCPSCPYFKRSFPIVGRMNFDSDAETETCKCSLCPLVTTTGLSQEDIPSHKGPTKKFGCCECPYETDRIHSLKSHFIRHQSKLEIEVYTCAKCTFETKRKESLIRHVKIHEHPDVAKKIKCEQCPYRCIRRDELKQHMSIHFKKTHEAKKFKCEECSFRCIKKSYLRKHMVRYTHEHPKMAKELKCDECVFGCIEKSHLKKDIAETYTKLHEHRAEKTESVQLENDDSAGKNGTLKKKVIKEESEGRTHLCPKCPYSTRRYLDKSGVSSDPDNKTCKCFLCPLLTAPGLSQEDVPSHKGPTKTFGCCECSYESNRKGNLKEHLKVHGDPVVEKKFQCDECPFRSVLKSGLKEHIVRRHIRLRQHRVDLKEADQVADHNFFGKNDSTKQELTVEPANESDHLCPRCPYFLIKYLKHCVDFDSDKETCKCYLCPTLRATELSQDIPSHKGSTQPFACCECSYEAGHRYRLKMHFLVHQSKLEIDMYKCAQCNFETKYKKYLVKHMETHADPDVVKKFKCEQCPFRCIRKYGLKQHMARHSKLLQYSCDQCSYSTHAKVNLAHHKRYQHNRSKVTFQCNQCGVRTKTKVSLQMHKRKHDPTKYKFKCDQCAYRTYHPSAISKHLLRHMKPGETEMYYCATCDFQSKYKASLSNHIKICLKKEEIHIVDV